jgi:hypothetical protein
MLGSMSWPPPSNLLCAAGTPSAIVGSGSASDPWTWTCAGLAGGTTASCSAFFLPETM